MTYEKYILTRGQKFAILILYLELGNLNPKILSTSTFHRSRTQNNYDLSRDSKTRWTIHYISGIY